MTTFLISMPASFFLQSNSCCYDLWRDSRDITSMYSEMIQNDFIFSQFYKTALLHMTAFGYFPLTLFSFTFLFPPYTYGITQSYFYVSNNCCINMLCLICIYTKSFLKDMCLFNSGGGSFVVTICLMVLLVMLLPAMFVGTSGHRIYL